MGDIDTVARIRTVFTGVAGSPAYSNLYFGADSTDAGNCQAAVFGMWENLLNAIQAGVVITMENPIPIIDVATGETTDVAVGDGGTATAADSGDPLPGMVNGLVQLHTGLFIGGRELRGRSFVPYPTEAANDAGVPDSDYINAMQDAFNDMRDPLGDGASFCVYSKTHAQAQTVSGLSAWTKFASLRSRRD